VASLLSLRPTVRHPVYTLGSHTCWNFSVLLAIKQPERIPSQVYFCPCYCVRGWVDLLPQAKQTATTWMLCTQAKDAVRVVAMFETTKVAAWLYPLYLCFGDRHWPHKRLKSIALYHSHFWKYSHQINHYMYGTNMELCFASSNLVQERSLLPSSSLLMHLAPNVLWPILMNSQRRR
jgi:hypothetical protein